MSIINISKNITSAEDLKKDILKIMNQLINFDWLYQKVIFDLYMLELNNIGIQIVKVDYSFNEYCWEMIYMPDYEHHLNREHLDLYVVSIAKYFNSKKYFLYVSTLRDWLIENDQNPDTWMLSNNKINKSSCNIL